MTANHDGRPDSDATAAGLRQRRPSVSETILTTAKQVEAKVEQALIVLWDDLPTWRRDNHFIKRGYRVDSNSYWKSFVSLFYIHNESVNIWSHLLGALAFPIVGVWLYNIVAPRYGSANSSDVLVFGCFFGGAVLCLGMSGMYHTIMNHSPEVAKWGNKLDYSGIVFLIEGSFVPAMYYGLFCHETLMTVYLYMIMLLGAGCGVVSWVERFRTPEWRPYRAMMFVGLGVSGIIPVCHALTIYGYQDLDERMGLNWVLLQGFLYILGAVIYAVRWPERSFPETFDIWGSSHQLFHILILFAAASHLVGMAKAFDYHHNGMGSQCQRC
ncbi:mPR-like GPCR protein [Pseudomassariella vexata]|uniref:MPR-like GPCR protein n=1 Tax=Pseudomassariella vexata TaxID=1141098 RepID=A0A1Y2E564_9PEZI|nr:mPR-like GPCR protein [Pseudomassariella vexata]ORY66005.1 mPR-like GPCR protein [Pseudomassariella vexata]